MTTISEIPIDLSASVQDIELPIDAQILKVLLLPHMVPVYAEMYIINNPASLFYITNLDGTGKVVTHKLVIAKTDEQIPDDLVTEGLEYLTSLIDKEQIYHLGLISPADVTVTVETEADEIP